jgi:peptidoglycan/LPS O-acetylase OafA/YrhL
MSELRALTSARGIAAWLVVLYHIRASIAGLPDTVEAVLAKGYLAVDFFFLLSGFVIWLTWHDRLRGAGAAAVARFLQKRVARIWPLHAVMLAFGIALALALRATGRSDPAFPFAELPLHVLLIQNWGFTHALRWNDPAWSISCELAAYLLFPLLVLAVDWRRWPAAAAVALAAAILALLYGAMHGAPTLGEDIPRYGLIRCLAEFAIGTVLAALFLRRPLAAYPLLAAAAAALAWALGCPETLAAPPTFAALLLALALSAGAPRHPLEGRLLHGLGEISYATYLSHFLLWKAFKLVAVRDAAAVSWGMIAVYLALVLAASVILYRWVERPAQRWINTRGRFSATAST